MNPRTLLLTLLQAATFVASPLAQDSPSPNPRPSGRVDFNIEHPSLRRPIGVFHAGTNRLDSEGNPTVAPKARRYLYLPLLLLEQREGRIDATVADGRLTLHLQLDRPGLRTVVKNHLIDQGMLDSGCSDTQVQLVPLKKLSVRTRAGFQPAIEFAPFEALTGTDRVPLTATIAAVNADRFLAQLANGHVTLDAEMTFDGQEDDSSLILLRVSALRETHAFKDLLGGAEGRAVSRRQVSDFFATAANSRGIEVWYGPDGEPMLPTSDLLALLGPVESRACAGWEALSTQFKELGWNPEDFRSDLITSSRQSGSSEQQRSFASDVQKAVEANASFLGVFNAAADVDYRERVAKSTLDRWGFQSEKVGNMVVPKAVSIYRVDRDSWISNETLRIARHRMTARTGMLTTVIDGRIHLAPPAELRDREAWVAARERALVPKFVPVPFLGPLDEVPKGWVVLEGQVLPEDSPLRRVFPEGRLPDFRGRMPMGRTEGLAVGQLAGSAMIVVPAFRGEFTADKTPDYDRPGNGNGWLLKDRERDGWFVIDTGGAETSAGRPGTKVEIPEQKVSNLPPVVGVVWIMRVD